MVSLANLVLCVGEYSRLCSHMKCFANLLFSVGFNQSTIYGLNSAYISLVGLRTCINNEYYCTSRNGRVQDMKLITICNLVDCWVLLYKFNDV